MAQSVKRLTSAQLMISQSVSSSSMFGSVLTAQTLEPALDSVSPSLSKINTKKKKNSKRECKQERGADGKGEREREREREIS